MADAPDVFEAPPQGKLFVGQVPRETTEEDLLPIFAAFGAVEEVSIIRDKLTKAHKGCAFVTFAPGSAASVAAAIESLHGKVSVFNSSTPLQVKAAEVRAAGDRAHKVQ